MQMKDGYHHPRHVFVVLGMLRCGTSVVSRGLKTLGIDLGHKLVPASNVWNPKGFWEDEDIIRINARARKLLNETQEGIRCIDPVLQTNETLDSLRNYAARLVQQRFASTDYWGFKDPNTSKLLPFWQSVFELAQVDDHYVIVLRNPLSSAQSYHKLTGTDIEHGLLVWLAFLLSAMDGTVGRNALVVSYDLLMQAPRAQLERIREKLDIALPVNQAAMDDYVNTFLDKSLLHYEYSVTDLHAHPAAAISPLCIQVYECLLKVATDELALDSEAFVSAWSNIKREYTQHAAIYAYIDVLLQRNSQMKKSMRSLHKSRLWKMIYPLRLIDQVLREYRKKRNEKKQQAIYG